MNGITKHNSNEEKTVVWKTVQCSNSTDYWKGLSEVFIPQLKTWNQT